MDIRKIRKIISLVKEQNISEIEICEGEESVRISQFVGFADPIPATAAATVIPVSAQPPQAVLAIDPQPETQQQPLDSKYTINSPMVGTFYASPSPDAKTFVEIGQHVNIGDVICIVEAMKMFNQIEADRTGKITSCLVENGYPVEYGQPLFVIED